MRFDELCALVAAAGDHAAALGQRWNGEPANDPVQAAIIKLVEDHHDSVSRTLAKEDLNILSHLDDCRLCHASNLIKFVYRDIESNDQVIEALLRRAFERRLDYLKAHGFISEAVDQTVAISHLGKGVVRVFGTISPEKDGLPRAFIGSSTEGLPIARHLQTELDDVLGCLIWNQGTVFGLGDATIEALERAVHSFSFGIFVFTPDDKIISRGTEKMAGRDNVLFELGLFIGKLSRRRAFLVHSSEVCLPSDLSGMTNAVYRPVDIRNKGALEIALGPVAQKIRVAVNDISYRSDEIDCA